MYMKNNNSGFTLMELVIYIFVSSILLVIISSLVMGIFTTRRKVIAEQLLYNDARFVVNFLNNRIHNVDLIDDVSPAAEEFHFYELPNKRFSLELLDGDLIYREVEDTGSGFPDQSTASPIVLNSKDVDVKGFVMVSYDDNDGNPNRAIRFNIVMSAGDVSRPVTYKEEMFGLFFSLR